MDKALKALIDGLRGYMTAPTVTRQYAALRDGLDKSEALLKEYEVKRPGRPKKVDTNE
jgi:hypothetical protein